MLTQFLAVAGIAASRKAVVSGCLSPEHWPVFLFLFQGLGLEPLDSSLSSSGNESLHFLLFGSLTAFILQLHLSALTCHLSPTVSLLPALVSLELFSCQVAGHLAVLTASPANCLALPPYSCSQPAVLKVGKKRPLERNFSPGAAKLIGGSIGEVF